MKQGEQREVGEREKCGPVRSLSSSGERLTCRWRLLVGCDRTARSFS